MWVVDPSTALLFGGLVFANLAAWVSAFALFADRPVIMATALLAWVFGLRHAVDADHIAAIDNAVRKLVQAGGTPKCAGLYFALGHSTVVVMATMLLSETAIGLWGEDSLGRRIGGLIGTSVSAAFLLLIALINLVTFISLWRTFRSVRWQASHRMENLDAVANGPGVLARMLRPAFRVVTKTWHMYPLGLLFGLGFDTATAIGLISISAAEAVRATSAWSVLVFPALFAAGMTLVDTADSALMVSAYRWAFVDPLRKLWYNLTITGASVVTALFIGGVEALDLLGRQFDLSGHPWSAIASLNDSLAGLGFVVIGLFGFTWLVSVALYHAFVADRMSAVSGPNARSLECTNASDIA
ncbi:HoxN/HupN/NixA family nickel/cobalt transporter [Bradyrhizobium macuxiense]|uniref:HoxN/HupN/NixA family nickel/cobalt transporter n=1 Tax=Bradyrhizobium macuxiense TaxID=1755647 RepID=UPI001FD98993|nr:HoxN/HupN/NixA family nickel/cobalt transporter [Bradyrhizobium macuxiense]